MAFMACVYGALMIAHFDEDSKHTCPPCEHKKDWSRFYNLVNSKDSGCMILETGIVTFKPHYK